MKRERIFRMSILSVVGVMLSSCGQFEGVPLASAADRAAGKEYIAVFSRETAGREPFAIIEKPAGVPIGTGSQVEIDAFTLRVAPIDATDARVLLRKLPALDAGESQKLPPGFRVYADRGSVQASYAGGSDRYKLTFTDPADVEGQGGRGGGSSASGGGSGGSM